ncbi:hypothetical protein C427_0840 [Paraglaciecola psychrophila 170]|uniref:Uncharacterized protein n=1 Tax=Paraglaciecola psychrophila 170 TaxID=1129794 RepID=K6Z1R2_9ALTE|nr:hypothetical protein C427_0840 [Paraglaciecola psychrophila 170]GAC38989.1 hypothetical protein GPSY_3378 [Paraglaciecola psychrophila 170]
MWSAKTGNTLQSTFSKFLSAKIMRCLWHIAMPTSEKLTEF